MLVNNKKSLRRLYGSIRRGIEPGTKSELDGRIISYLVNDNDFISAQTVLTYVSYNSEIDTFPIIEYALTHNKRVAVPVWKDGKMSFYEIFTTGDLCVDAGGIKTVDTALSYPIERYENCVCITPGLSFDRSFNRLGYGGGYYDRFFCEHEDVVSIGLCYERCVSSFLLPNEAHDIAVNKLITENAVYRRRFENDGR